MRRKKAINGERPFLPEEIIINILKRLPVKSLKRFQCVCKHWNNLFKTPSFIQDHLHHSTHKKSSLVIGPGFSDHGFYLLLFNSKMQFREFEIPPLINSLEGLGLVGSCNGLLCLFQWGKHHADPLLWNPATREIKQIPGSCNDSSDPESETESYLVRDDPDPDWHFGFGFNPVINDYKIVKIFEYGLICEVGVYSLSTGCWRNIPFDNIKDVSISGHSVTVNGVIFWCGSKYRQDRKVIVSFDLVAEVFAVIPYPAFTGYSQKLAVYDDKLAIISYHKARNSQDLFLYFGVMEEGATNSSGERWSSSEKYIGNSDSILCPWASTIWRNQIVSIDLGPGRPAFFQYERKYTKHLYLIDVIANEYKWFDIPEFKRGELVSVFSYVESLVPFSGNFQIEEP